MDDELITPQSADCSYYYCSEVKCQSGRAKLEYCYINGQLVGTYCVCPPA